MADLVYNTFKKEVMDETVKLSTDTLKVVLVTASYVANVDDDVVDAGGANDVVDHEANVTNYTRGWGGAGRKTLASKVFTTDKTNDRGELDAADSSWTALGNGTNQTLTQAVIVKEGGVNDTTSRLCWKHDFSSFTTNGADFTLQWNSEGILHLTSLLGGLQLVGQFRRQLWSKISEGMSPAMVARAKRLGFRPHIYRSVKPIRVDWRKAA